MPDDKKKNSSVDVNKIISQADDLLKALDSEGETSDPTVEPVLTGGSKAKSSQAISSDEKGSSSPVDIKANAKDSEPPLFEITNSGKLPAIFLVLIVLLPIGNMLYTNSQNKSQKPYMSYQQILREERAKIAKEKAEKEKSEQEMNSRLEIAKSDGWTEVGNSGLVYRPCHPSSNDASLGKPCSLPSGNPKWWIGYELYCLDISCQGRMEITIGDQEGIEKRFDYGTVLMFAREKRTAFADSEKNQVKFGLIKAAGFCKDQALTNWKKC